MIDAHNHLHFDSFDADRDDVINAAIERGVTAILLADYDHHSRPALLDLAGRAGVFATLGFHPWAVGESDDVSAELAQLVTDVEAHMDQIVGIGELGLDRNVSNWDQQLDVFRAQLSLARDYDLPIVLHSVKANEDVLKILKEDGVPNSGGMVHGFGGSAEQALRFRAFDIDISIGTTVTKPNARKLFDVVKAIGLDHLMVETDAPSRPPEQSDRERCEPSDIFYVIDAVAKTLGIDVDDVSTATSERVRHRFKLTTDVLK